MIIPGAVYVELQTGNTYKVTSLAEHTEISTPSNFQYSQMWHY